MCLPVSAILTSSEVSGAAFKLYACYCAHREGFEASVKSEQVHAETGIGTAYISTLKFELLKAGWIGLSKTTAKGIVPLKGFEGAAEHIRTERKLSKIERTSDKKASNIESKQEEVSIFESPVKPPEKLSKNERSLSDGVSKIERNVSETFENQKVNPGTPVAPYSAKNTSTDKTEANASGASAGSAQEFIGRLLQLRRNHERVKQLPVEQGEAAAAKWMHRQGWPLEDVSTCYAFLLRQDWRGAPVTLMTVKSHFPAWRNGELSDGTRTEPQPSKPTRAETVRSRDYSVFDRDGGADSGSDSRPLPRLETVAGQVRR